MRGIKTLTMKSREMYFLRGSKLDLRAPSLPAENYPTLTAGQDGKDGKDGVDGPTGMVR